MGETTAIGWTDATHNEWIGCTEVGPPCFFCYARELDRRYQWGVPGAERVKGAAPHWGRGAPRHRTSEANRRKPYTWNAKAQAAGKVTKVFCNSLSDVFDNEVDDAWRADLFTTWRETPWLRWIVVTKRTPNILKMLPKDWGGGYPNVGLVATVGDQPELDRDAPRLLSIPARWHGFSMEPQLGPMVVPLELAFEHRRSIWCITGGESAQAGSAHSDPNVTLPEAPRSWDPRWAEALLRTSRLASNVHVFVKQTGARPIGIEWPSDGMGKDPDAWPDAIRVRNFPPELSC